MTTSWHPQTFAIRGGRQDTQFGETCEHLALTSGFTYRYAEDAEARFADTDDGFMYSRVGNPTVQSFERRMAGIEGAEAGAATATGMAAVHACLMSQLRTGDRVVAASVLFGSCDWIITELLPRFGIDVELVDGPDLAGWARALETPTKLVFLESPGNPTLELVDIEAVCKLAHDKGAKVIVDNVFATPILQKPMALGADFVIYSATKHIDGQGRCLGGVILCDRDFREGPLQAYLKHTGPSLSPFNAWNMLKGLETLELRVREHVRVAGKVVDYLIEGSPASGVRYPGHASHPQYDLACRQMSAGGNMVAFRVGGGRQEAFAFLNRLKLISISNNLGDAKSLITHPASTTHSRLSEERREQLGIHEDLVRLSIGLEHPDDIIADLHQAITGQTVA